MSSEESAVLSAGARVGRYRIEKPLGAGQMGDVYEASSEDGTRVALKMLRRQASAQTELERRFRREAALCHALRHPNVVSVSDYGVHTDGSPYLVMTLLHGADLETTLTETGPLAPEVAVAIARDACAGLGAAHAYGVVHRDLKPANIFLDERGEGELVTVVCDFGVAKVFDEDGALTASGAVLGTPLYMAPEQLLDSKRVDTRCDVWALGMVLYHALAGRAALADAHGIADLVVLLRHNDIPPLQSFAPWVPATLARVVHAALLPIESRLESAEAFARALDEWGPKPARMHKTSIVALDESRRVSVATRALLPARASELGTPDEATIAELRSPHAASAPPPVSDPFLGLLVGGRYRVGVPLGDGGMGKVYEAVDTRPDGGPREVAVKVMTSAAHDADAKRRFLREARAAARIAHGNVTRTLDFGLDDATGAPFLVMERLRGRDLAKHLARCGPLDPAVAVSLFLQAASGLEAAHEKGVIHRDIKPSNLFVHEGDGGSVAVKICDFGIAKQLATGDGGEASAELTRTGGLLGSPLYMSPEQARSAKSVDARSDVFSFALSLHEALSGEKPWRGRTSMGEIILAVCTEDVPPLTACAPWVPAPLSAIVARGLARDPAARWSSIAELARAIQPFASHESVTPDAIVGVSAALRATVLAESTPQHVQETADAVSVATRPEKKRSRGAMIATSIVVAGVLAAVAVVVVRAGPTTSKPQTAAPAPTPSAPPSIEPAMREPPPAPSPSASAEPAPSATTPSARPNIVARPRAPTAEPRASAPPPTVSSAKPAASLGRGMTATDLPP